MAGIVCEVCGARNAADATFCTTCNAYLAWSPTGDVTAAPGTVGAGGVSAPADHRSGSPTTAGPDGAGLVAGPAASTGGVDTPPPDAGGGPSVVAGSAGPSSTADPRIQVAVTPTAVELAPIGGRVGLDVTLSNLSELTDVYAVDAPGAPSWLRVAPVECEVWPGASATATLMLSTGDGPAAGGLPPAGSFEQVIRARSTADTGVEHSTTITVTVGVLPGQIEVRVDPAVVTRRADAGPTSSGSFAVLLTVRGGNVARSVTLTGRDREGVTECVFDPATVVVPATGAITVPLVVSAPRPPDGASVSRMVTIEATPVAGVADDVGTPTAETSGAVGDPGQATATFIQESPASAPLRLRVEPSVVRLRPDPLTTSPGASVDGRFEVVLDNEQGTRRRRVFLSGRDPENAVRFRFGPPSLDVLPGTVERVRLAATVPTPEPGQDAGHALTILATIGTGPDADREELTATATLAVSTPVPVALPPVVVHLEPSIVRADDRAQAEVDVLVDNRAAAVGRRILLSARDPERVVRFTFTPAAVDVPPGGTARSRLTVQAPPPPPGEEATRTFSVRAAVAPDRAGPPPPDVEVTGTFVQRTAEDVPVALRLEPQIVRVQDGAVGQTEVVIDNRRGHRPRTVLLRGSDPEGVVAFSFGPPGLVVHPGRIARAGVRVQAPPPSPGEEVTRSFTVTAVDETGPGDRDVGEVETTGTFAQRTSALPPDRPVTVRLDPTVVRTRNRGSAVVTAVVDNRGGSRDRRVWLTGHDPERAVRFAFDPAVLDLAAGRSGTTRVRVSAPEPEAGQSVSREFTVVAADGEQEVTAGGTFVQDQDDRRPLWRILLTVLGAALLAGGTLLPWNTGAGIAGQAVGSGTLGSQLNGFDWGLPALQVAAGQFGLATPSVPDVPDDFDPAVSVGAVLVLLAVLTLVGLAGPQGRLTRWSALVAGAVTAVFLAGSILLAISGRTGAGPWVCLGGAVIAFAGGVLARPRGSWLRGRIQ